MSDCKVFGPDWTKESALKLGVTEEEVISLAEKKLKEMEDEAGPN